MPSRLPDEIVAFNINASDAAAQRPHLAIEASRIFAKWAGVEMALGQLATLLVGDVGALILFDLFKSRNQQFDALRKIAEERIASGETRDLLLPLFKLINKAAEPRNTLAHSVWGTLDDLPDALILTEPMALIHFGRKIQLTGERTTGRSPEGGANVEIGGPQDPEKVLEITKQFREKIEVWRHIDFSKPLELLADCQTATIWFASLISLPQNSVESDQLRSDLVNLFQKNGVMRSRQ